MCPSASSWLRLPHGAIKVNFDAHLYNSRRVGLRVVCRDEFGMIKAATVKNLSVVWESTMAKWR